MSSSPRKRPTPAALTLVLLLVVMAAFCALFVVTGLWDKMFPVQPVTTQAREINDLYTVIMAMAVGVFLLVEGLILWSVLRYRRRPEDTELPPQTHGNNLVEIVWTLIPTVIVMVLFVLSMNTLGKVDAVSASPDLQVRAVAGQFQWQFDYLSADGKTKLFTESTPLESNGGGLVLPAGRTVHLQLTSPDVIHAFYVPHFLFKRDVVPGMNNNFDFTIDASEAGQTWRGQCAELCGIGHWTMLFDVVVKTPDEFAAWQQGKIAAANATPAPLPSGAAVLELNAKDIAFDKKELSVAPDKPFAIKFTNNDPAGVVHDVEIRQSDGKTVLQKKPTVDGGGKSTTSDYTALKAGTYTFICSIHPIPQMTGTLTVK